MRAHTPQIHTGNSSQLISAQRAKNQPPLLQWQLQPCEAGIPLAPRGREKEERCPGGSSAVTCLGLPSSGTDSWSLSPWQNPDSSTCYQVGPNSLSRFVSHATLPPCPQTRLLRTPTHSLSFLTFLLCAFLLPGIPFSAYA